MSKYMQTFRSPGYENAVLAQGLAPFVRHFTSAKVPATEVLPSTRVLGSPAALKAGLDWYRATPLPIAARLGPVTVPTLFIWGSRDPFFDRVGAIATRKYVTGSYRFVVINGGDHGITQLMPNRVAGLIVRQLDSEVLNK